MTRILTAAALFAIVIPVLIFSSTVVFPIFLALAGVMCIWEICRCKGIQKKVYLWLPAALYVAFAPFLTYFSFTSSSVTEGRLLKLLFSVPSGSDFKYSESFR